MCIVGLSEESAKRLSCIREKAGRLLYPPVHHLHFTDHSISHSDRIIEIIARILNEEPLKKLSEEEYFTLCAAAYLHDIGMQIPLSKLLTFPALDNLLSKSGLTKKDIQNNQKALANFIREWHHLFSEYMITKSVTDWDDLDLCLNDLYPAQIRKIALVAKGHRKVDLHGQEFSQEAGERLQLLATLLRFADAIDCDQRRVDLARLGILDLSAEEKVHWFSHYCVEKVEIMDHFLQIHALVPTGWPEVFKSIFIFPLWKEYYSVLDILKVYKIVLVWVPPVIKEDEIMDSILQRADPTGQLRKYITQRCTNIWMGTDIFDIIAILGEERIEKPELELSPYYFTGVESFEGIQVRQWPRGAYACSYSMFDDIETSGRPIWSSPTINKEEIHGIITLPPPDFELEEGKKYGFRVDFYYREDLVFLSQRGIFWLIERELLEKKTKMFEEISALSAEKRDVYLSLITESIGAYEEAIKAYLRLTDTILEGKIDVIHCLVIILEKIFNELEELGWINERDQVRRSLTYWARLSEKPETNVFAE